MPMPYSHVVLAERIARAANLSIIDKTEYYVGAFYPDIRYYTKQPREKYHFATSILEPYDNAKDVSKDFLLGYKVHLLIDEVWEYPEIKAAYKQAFPSFIRSRMTRGLQVLALEMYCHEQAIESIKLKPIENKLTRELGVTTSETQRAVTSMQRYLDNPSLRAAYVMSEEAQLLPSERLKTVGKVVSSMNKPVLGTLAKHSVREATRPIFSLMVKSVVEHLTLKSAMDH